MKICVTTISCATNETDLKSWVEAYKESSIDIPAVLYCDTKSNMINSLWPYEILVKPIYNSITTESEDQQYHTANINMFKILQTLNSYNDIGESLVMNLFSLIRKNFTINDIPECSWGVIKRNEFAKRYQETKKYEYFNQSEDCNFMERIEPSVQLLKKDISSRYCELYYNNIQKIKDLKGDYPEFILALCHKKLNGSFLSEDWGWPSDSLIRNKTRMIECYYDDYCQYTLRFAKEGKMKIRINGEIIT